MTQKRAVVSRKPQTEKSKSLINSIDQFEIRLLKLLEEDRKCGMGGLDV